MNERVGLLLSCALALACGGSRTGPHEAKAGARDGGADGGFDIEALDAREHPPLPKQAIARGDLTGSVEGTASPTIHEPGETSTQIDVPVGTEATMMCFVYSTAIDPGGQLAQMMRFVGKNVDLKMVLPRDVSVVGEYPLVFVDAAYTLKGKPTSGGIVKAVVFAHPVTPFLCLHDEIGYHETFKRIVVGLASSLKLAGKEPKAARYVELEIEKQDGHAMGYTRSELGDVAEGKRLYQAFTTSFTLRTPTELDATDTARTELWERDGTVPVLSYAESENGELSEDMTLRRTTGNEYTYEGTHAGKKISGKLKTKAPYGFASDERVSAGVKKLLAEGGELRVETYNPGVDPTAPLEEVVRRLSAPERKVTLQFGKLQMTSKIDAEGRMEQATVTLGQATISYERIFMRGSY